MLKNWVNKMEKIQRVLRTKKIKHITFVSLVVIMLGWVVYRFVAVAYENNRVVFNATRAASEIGMPVMTMTATKQDGKLFVPVAIRNNRGYVSAQNVSNFKSGQKIGNGKITFVSKDIDYNTGMHLIKTSGVSDGVAMVENNLNGYFVPLYAIHNNSVMVVQDGIATVRPVNIARQDSENTYITSGLSDGDIVILSNVSAGQKVKIKE